MKDFFKKNAGLIIMVVSIIIVVWYFFLRKKTVVAPAVTPSGESSFSLFGFGKAVKRSETNPLNKPTCRRCWITETDPDGTTHCRWYDDNGANTVTYDRACSSAQARMKGSTNVGGGN